MDITVQCQPLLASIELGTVPIEVSVSVGVVGGGDGLLTGLAHCDRHTGGYR